MPITLNDATARDNQSRLCLRDQFVIPSKADVKRRTLSPSGCTAEGGVDDHEPCTYLCGNSLGLQPRNTAKYIASHLSLWRQKGVYGHFKEVTDSLIPPWLHIGDVVTGPMARVVGASAQEVAVMQTLTANLHLLMASFYKPTKDRYKIIMERKAFPSDHFAVESQIQHHGLDPKDALILLEPENPDDSPLLSTEHVCATIDAHAGQTALVMLPGVQFYTGQLFDIPRVTAHAQSKGISMGWDLAHAAGNVPLYLHDWNVDFAVWCNYKYLNCGPGAIGGLFVHERHGVPGARANVLSAEDQEGSSDVAYRHRLAGWWGSGKSSRFSMDNKFSPIPGAAGFQLSNPSALDCSAVLASLSVFDKTSMEELREKSLQLTDYLEVLLLDGDQPKPYRIITSSDPAQRGAQLSVRIREGLMDHVLEALENKAIVVDERKPDVVRVAPAPMYNTFEDCWRFAHVFRRACSEAAKPNGG